MTLKYFITGTDTDIGKTYTTVALLKHFNQQGYQTAALKPIAAGATDTPHGLRNADALALQRNQSYPLAYDTINPWCFAEPVSPHLACGRHTLHVKALVDHCHTVASQHPDLDLLMVEGAGGWQVPINNSETIADFAKTLDFPVILVVGMRLGCLNHTLLTWHNIRAQGCRIAGWVANHCDPDMARASDNLDTLCHYLGKPPLASIPFGGSVASDFLLETHHDCTH